jgi:hypothetical protein
MSRMALHWAHGTGLMHGIGLINLRQPLVSNYQKGGGRCVICACMAGAKELGRGGGV